MNISKNVIEKTAKALQGLLEDNHLDIEKTFNSEDDNLSISMSVKFSVAKGGGIGIETGISFVKESIKQKTNCIVDDKQKPLFEND